jgi:hypothetical protein
MTSPKSRFLSNALRATAWHEFTASNAFIEATDFALLELVHQSAAGPVYDAQASAHRLDGARRLLYILSKLGEQTLTSPERKAPELDYGPEAVPAHLRPTTTTTPPSK